MGRTAFAAGLLAATSAVAAAWVAAEAALPAMARLLSPRGVNAGLALNAIWLAAGLAYLAALAWLLARRLGAIGRPRLLALAVIGPLAGWALLSDAVFLWRQRLPLPEAWDRPLAVLGALAAGAVLAECLLRPARERRPD